MPDKEKEPLSMYDKVRQHGEAITSHDERIASHDERISNLEEADRRHEEQIAEIKANSLSLENTMMKESRETQDVVKRLENTVVNHNDKLYDIVESAMGYQKDVAVHKHEQRMKKIETWSNVFLKIATGLTAVGGIGYLILQHILNQIGGN